MSADENLKGVPTPSMEEAWKFYETYTLPRRVLVSYFLFFLLLTNRHVGTTQP